MLRDSINDKKVSSAFDYADRTASANGNTIDVRGYGKLAFLIQTATVTTADGSNYFTLSLQHGDASDMSDAAAVTAANGLLGSNIVLNDATYDNKLAMIGYVGSKRYVRLVATETGTSQAAFSAIALQEMPQLEPVGDEAIG